MPEKKLRADLKESATIRLAEPNVEGLDEIIAKLGVGTRPTLANSLLAENLQAYKRCGSLEGLLRGLRTICQPPSSPEPEARAAKGPPSGQPKRG